MRNPTLPLAAAALAASALASWPSGAHAVQLAISQPPDQEIFETRSRAITLVFELVNTGVPVDKTIELLSFAQSVVPNDSTGDFTREVLAKYIPPGPCMNGGEAVTFLQAGESCFLTSMYLALDGDPFDRHKVVDRATWIAGISVNWRFRGINNPIMNDVEGGLVTIKDDPVPEPAAWALMLSGFAAVGGALRWRRSRGARAAASESGA